MPPRPSRGLSLEMLRPVPPTSSGDFRPLNDLTSKPPPDFLTPGARLCTIRNCTQIIPSPEGYPWKMCEPCRIRTRNTARRRRMKKMGEIVSEDPPWAESIQANAGSGSESEDIPLADLSAARRTSEGLLRRCKRHDCGLWINPESQDTLCNQCKKRKLMLKVPPSDNVGPPPPKIVIKRAPPPKKTIPAYTEYICWSSLLDVFHKRIGGFLEAHRCYQRFKQTSQPAQAVQKATFKFEGEYSAVALDFEVLGKKPEVHRHTMQLKDEIGRAGDLLFSSTYWVTTLQLEEGIATRFKFQSRSLRGAEMHGELEIAVLPDHSHILFPGQRTIVRFYLVV
ncbi:hypothetical protein C0995_011367 [Termitomyces sp. Mi166|nr:hypothetical protein C0995_011367 [Termitomyces sp. Mi166\